MSRSLALGGPTPLEPLIVLLFALNIGWIAMTFVSAAAGATIISDAPSVVRSKTATPNVDARPY